MPDNLGKRLARQVHPRTSEFVHFARWEFAVATRHAGIPTLLVRVRAAQIQSVQMSGKSCRAIWEKDLPDQSIPGLANSCILHIWEFAVGTRHAGIPTLLVRVRSAQIQSVQMSGKSCRIIWEKELSDQSIPGVANSCIMHIWNSVCGDTLCFFSCRSLRE